MIDHEPALVIKLIRVENRIFGWVEHQDESLRNNEDSRTLAEFAGFGVRSDMNPCLYARRLCVRGRTKHHDHRSFVRDYDSEQDAATAETDIMACVKEINAKHAEANPPTPTETVKVLTIQ